MNAAAPFLATFAAHAGALAIVEARGRATTYGALLRQVHALARLLHARGLAPGDRVLLQVPNGPLFAASTLAVIALGAVPVLADPGLGDAVYLARVRAAAPRLALIHPLVAAVGHLPPLRRRLEARDVRVPPPPGLGDLRDLRTVHLTAAALRAAARSPLGRPPVALVDVPPDHDAVLVFTGGTTRDPRGVRHTHAGLAAYLDAVAALVADLAFAHFLADTPQQVLYALRLGKTAHLTPGRKALCAPFARARFASGAVDAYFGAPWIWQEMMAAAAPGERLPPSLRAVLLGGAPISAPFLARLADFLDPTTAVTLLYGLTEAGPVTAVDAAAKRAWSGAGDLVGRPLPGVAVTVADPDDDGLGEVQIAGPSLFAGYLGEPPRAPGAPFATGDLGRLTADGQLALVGRKKDMIIRRGVNLYPPSFEATVEALVAPSGAPWVRRCALIGVWNEARADEDVVLAVEPADGFDARAFRTAVAAALGADAAPDRLWVLPQLPVVGRLHKIDKAALRRRAGGEGGP